LRRRFLEDMRIKGLQPKTQTMYLRAMRDFTQFLGRSPDTATPEDLCACQLDMKEKGVGAPIRANRLSVFGFFFSVTCAREEMKRHMRDQRLAKKIPMVLSAEEVIRILEVAPGPGLKYRAAFSVAYGGGLRASESDLDAAVQPCFRGSLRFCGDQEAGVAPHVVSKTRLWHDAAQLFHAPTGGLDRHSRHWQMTDRS
jgi:site-specific recombinase XerD